jgi:hypothetical protein
MIRCPNCNSGDSRVLNTFNDDEGRDRERLCQGCGARYLTEERVSHLLAMPKREPELPRLPKSPRKRPAPKAEVASAPAKAPAPARTQAPARFHPVSLTNGGDVFGKMPMPIQALLMEWWNTARRQRYASAAWTERAWLGSVDRVAALLNSNNFLEAQALATAGAEHGWQSLQQDYLRGAARQLPPAANTCGGKEQAAVDAIEALIGGAGA